MAIELISVIVGIAIAFGGGWLVGYGSGHIDGFEFGVHHGWLLAYYDQDMPEFVTDEASTKNRIMLKIHNWLTE